MEKTPVIQFSLGRKFLTRILLFSSFVTLCLTSIQLYTEYHQGKKELVTSFTNISQPDLDIISNSLWFIDKNQINLELNSLHKIPGVAMAKIKTSDGDLYSSGSLDGISSINTYKYKLIYKGNSIPEPVGTLEIIGTLDHLKNSVIDKTIFILVAQAFKTFLVSFFILFIYLKLVGHRLEKIANFANQISLNKLGNKLNVNEVSPDELDEISKTINSMSDRISDQLNAVKLEQDSKLRLERKFYEDQKLKALGTLAGGVSHDFKNILQSLMVVSEVIEKSIQIGEPPEKSIETLKRITQRGQDLTEKILLFSRNEDIHFKELSLPSIARNSLELFKLTLPKGVKLISNIPDEDIIIEGDKVQIEQLLLNLLGNAAQAFDRSHSLKNVELRLEKVIEEKKVILSVSDNGTGIPESVQAKMFDPFFSTKEVGKGTGLGLTISKTVIDAHNGSVNIISKQGSGTIFEVTLPILG